MAKTTHFQCLSHPSHRWLLPPVAMVSKKHYIKKVTIFDFKVHAEKPARVHFIPDLKVWALVSSPGEFHPQALSEPDLRLSPHPAPIIQPLKALFCPLVPPLLPKLTAVQNWIIQSLRSMPITGTSSLLRIVPPLLIASIL